jgi:hypothetical protein
MGCGGIGREGFREKRVREVGRIRAHGRGHALIVLVIIVADGCRARGRS